MKKLLLSLTVLFYCAGAAASVQEIKADDTVKVGPDGCIDQDRPTAEQLGFEGR